MPYFSMNFCEKTFEDFELRRLLVHAPDLQAVLLKQIHDAKRQRVVRADDGEIHLLLLREREQLGQIFRANVDAFNLLIRIVRSSCAMPALPGAHHICVTCGDCASFHTRACSRPPEPMTRIFMKKKA